MLGSSSRGRDPPPARLKSSPSSPYQTAVILQIFVPKLQMCRHSQKMRCEVLLLFHFGTFSVNLLSTKDICVCVRVCVHADFAFWKAQGKRVRFEVYLRKWLSRLGSSRARWCTEDVGIKGSQKRCTSAISEWWWEHSGNGAVSTSCPNQQWAKPGVSKELKMIFYYWWYLQIPVS